MDDTSNPKAVIYRVKPTVVRRRFAIDPKTSSAMDEPPPSSVYPHPDYNLPEDDELRGE